jgi:hypothetical protein
MREVLLGEMLSSTAGDRHHVSEENMRPAHERFPMPSELADIAPVLQRCWEANPTKRCTAAAAAAALEALVLPLRWDPRLESDALALSEDGRTATNMLPGACSLLRGAVGGLTRWRVRIVSMPPLCVLAVGLVAASARRPSELDALLPGSGADQWFLYPTGGLYSMSQHAALYRSRETQAALQGLRGGYDALQSSIVLKNSFVAMTPVQYRTDSVVEIECHPAAHTLLFRCGSREYRVELPRAVVSMAFVPAVFMTGKGASVTLLPSDK